MTSTTTPVRRGCGTRMSGGIYAECGSSPWGRPVEHFLADPPMPVPPDWALSAQGVKLIERDGVTHLVDWIGRQHYPNVADFVEEVRRFGLSRRLPRTLDFSRLTLDSRILVVHARAVIMNHAAYRPSDGAPYECPSDVPEIHRRHVPGNLMCAGLWWEDVDGGEALAGEDARRVLRSLPSLAYHARRPPDGVLGAYQPGIFGSFPLTNLVVVRHAQFPKLEQNAMARAEQAHVPVDLVPA